MGAQTPQQLLDVTAKAELQRRGSPPTAENLSRMKNFLATNRPELSRAATNTGNEQRTAGRTTSGVELSQVKADPFEQAIARGMGDEAVQSDTVEVDSAPVSKSKPVQPSSPNTASAVAPQATTPELQMITDAESGESFEVPSDLTTYAPLLAALGIKPAAQASRALSTVDPAIEGELVDEPKRLLESSTNNPRLPPPDDIDGVSVRYTGPTMLPGGGGEAAMIPDLTGEGTSPQMTMNPTEKAIYDKLGDTVDDQGHAFTVKDATGQSYHITPTGEVMTKSGKLAPPATRTKILRALRAAI